MTEVEVKEDKGAPELSDARGWVFGAGEQPKVADDGEHTVVDVGDCNQLGCFSLTMADGSRKTPARWRALGV
jgi:hypothetical protein